jgi:pre-mRNA-processing factor 8
MSERVQLLLSDRILGMTLVPEGRVWNYGIGLTQLWSPNLSYAMTLDTPLLFWAEEHRPAAFLTVSVIVLSLSVLENDIIDSLLIWNKVKTVLMWRIVSHDWFIASSGTCLFPLMYILPVNCTSLQ